jgi:hypothetical protein
MECLVWWRIEKAVTKHLNEILQTSLDEIHIKLQVTSSISAIIRAVNKEFSLSANYPKGHGELVLEWMRKHYLGVLLFYVERAAGSRQYFCTEGSLAIFMNYPYYVEFLDTHLRKLKQNNNHQASILQQNLFVALTLVEMIALARLMYILHVAICMPFSFLAGKTHQFSEYGWGAADMAGVVDTLYDALKKIEDKPKLILDPLWMMGIFDKYRQKVPPFNEYIEMTFKTKQT